MRSENWSRHVFLRLTRKLAFLTFLLASLVCGARTDLAQEADFASLSEEEQQQMDIAERFLTVLERSPRRGTALDRVYGHHVEFGSLDGFVKTLRKRVEDNSEDGVGWMLLGMFEAQRGEDASAVDAFRKAEEHGPSDALASYYLGQSLLLIGQPEEAVLAFERATQRNPPRTDMLEIFRQLGRVHQRAQRTDEALQVWERLENLFPDDPRVQEQIAVTLVEEGEYKLALPRYEKLATMVRDDYRRVVYQIEAAELKIRDGRRDEGLADFETLLANLNPTGWLHRDVRRRIEEVYLRTGDQDGLVTYYENWLQQNKEDVGAMARLAKFLASSARVPEATEWMEKALKLAPSRTDLRKSFIDQLVDDQRYAEASKQYELLVKAAPGNQDFLRDWGRLVMKDKAVDIQQRRAMAGKIWSEIMAIRPDDALTNAQVADLYRQSNIEDKALELYQRAIELAPNDPQYREYLGEYYHILKRPEEARATWKEIASGDRRTAVNAARLAEVYNSFGYLNEAVREIAAACKLDAKEFALQLKASEYHNRTAQYDEALAYVSRAEKLATNDEEQAATLNQRIEIFQVSRRLAHETETLATSLNDAASVDDWHTLARYYEADRRWADATDAVNRALANDTDSILALTTSARIAELSGDYGVAAETNRKLAQVDRRSRSDHLMNVARLEAQLGRADQALQAGNDLIVSAPGNTDNYEFYARLCFQLGRMEEGLDALRKAVRINPTEPALIMSLGAALSREFRTDEAIEVYWRAFEKTDEIDDKASLTQNLAELYLQLNQFDKLIERFERDRRDDAKRREMTICLAQAHHSAGDFGTARMELESLLSENTRDTNLLQQLSKLCEEESDLDVAVEYQRRLVSIAPGHETEYRLANLLQQRGDNDEASDIFVRLTQREEDPGRLLRSLDSLLRQGSHEGVIAVTEPLLSEQRDDWELLYREGVAWASLEKFDEAENRFQRLLALGIPHHKSGIAAAEKFKQAQARARSNNLRGIQTTMPRQMSPLSMLSQSYQVRRAVGLEPDRSYYAGGRLPTIWMPEAYGMARMAAYGWLLKFEQDAEVRSEKEQGEHDADAPTLVDTLAAAAAKENVDRNAIYDYMYVEQLQNNLDALFKMARRLARDGGKEEKQYFLSSLRTRHINSRTQNRSSSPNQKPEKDPLSDEELDLMMECVAELKSDDEFKRQAMAGGGQVIVSGGRTYVMMGGRYYPADGISAYGIGAVAEELRLAGREEEADKLVRQQIDQADSSNALIAAMNILFEQEQFDELPRLYERWIEAALDEINKASTHQGSSSRMGGRGQTVSPSMAASDFFIRWMGKLGAEEENQQVLQIMDKSLTVVVAEGKKQRAARSNRRSRRATSTSRGSTSFSLYYGTESIRARLDYPPTNEYINRAGLMLLREAYEVLNRNDVIADLPVCLRARVAAASQSNTEEVIFEQLMLGYVLWWMDAKDEAVEILTTAASQLPDDPSFRLETAGLYQVVGDLDAALEVVESITPRDQRTVQQRELLALQLAERLGDIERARSAAERLFGLRLDTNTQLALVDQIRRLGMPDMAEAIVARVERRSGSQLNSLPQLMTLYQGQGKVELAKQIAHTILRRSKSPLSMMSSSGRNPFRYNRGGDANRAQALRLLQQTGALKELIARLELQLERSPDSQRTYEQLIEYYQVSIDRDKVQTLLEKGVQHRPDAIAMRYQLAKHLEQTGKTAEACDQYLEVLKRKPSWIADELYNVRRTFERANRSVDLVKAFDDINVKSIGQPYYVIDLVTNLLRGRGGDATDEHKEIALKLFERVFDAFPSYRNQMVTRLHDAELWKNPRIFELGKRGLIPSPVQVSSNPWFGVDRIYSWSSGGRVNAMFHQMLNGVAGTERVDELRAEIERAMERAPDWHGGKAMLALIDFKANKRDEAKQQLEELLSEEDRIKTMPSHTGWIIGQELDQFEDTRDIAQRLFEHASKGDGSIDNLEYSPIVRLVSLYEKNGRKEDARRLLLEKTRERRNDGYNDDYDNSIRIGNVVWTANKLLTMGYPVDSVKLYRQVLDTPAEILERAQQYGYADNAAGQAKKGLEASMVALNETNAAQAMSELLTAREDAVKGDPALDLMLRVPSVQAIQKEAMSSQLVSLLVSISAQDEIASGIETRLAELQQQYPADLSIAVTKALFALNQKADLAGNELQSLLAVVADNPLDEIAEGRRPNMRQRRQARQHAPLWLVARECLESEAYREIGRKLAEQAVAGARRQLQSDDAVAILYDWGKRSIELGDRDLAEARWSELLDLVTKRPERKQKTPGRAAPSRGRPIAPPANQSGGQSRTSAARSSVHLGLVSLPAAIVGQVAVPATPTRPSGPASRTLSDPQARGNRIPPLTLTQFRTAIEIALIAARHDMSELSQRAIKRSLEGGIPVPDPTPSGSASGMATVGAVMVRPPSSPTQLGNAGAIETEVANSLRKVLGVWETSDGYPAAEVYELLHPIVLPESRPFEIMMYADSSKILDAKTASLGVSMVRWAERAGKLDDLSQRIEARADKPTARVPALVLQSHIAMARGDLQQANELLADLDKTIRERPLQPMIQLACHAAIPAAEKEEIESNAFRILQFAVEQQYSQPDRNGNVALGSLVGMVNGFLAKTGDSNTVRDFFDSYLLSRQEYYSRSSGDYGSYRQQLDIAQIATEAAKTGATDTALDFVGRVVDVELTNYGRPNVKTALAVITKKLSNLPAQERYATWLDWTMPTEGRRTVRFVADFAPPIFAPDSFLDEEAKAWKASGSPFLCNLTELVAAAEEAGELSNLVELAKRAHDEQLPGSSFLLLIALIHDNQIRQAAPLIDKLIKTMNERTQQNDGQPRPDILPDYAVFRACMEHSQESGQLYRRGRHALLQHAKRIAHRRVVANIPCDFARREANDLGLDLTVGGDPGLRHWFGGATHGQLEDDVKSWWSTHEGHLLHLSGPPDMDFFHFKYPLVGDFQVELDCYYGDWAETDAGFGGVYVESQAWGSRMRVASLASHEIIHRKKPYLRSQELYGSVKLTSQDGQLQYWLNNYLVYEEEVGDTSPWFVLFTEAPRLTSFKNIRLTGNPTIPREVKLISGDSMDGWNTRFFGETQARKRLMAEPTSGDRNDYNTRNQQQEPTEYDWQAESGVLTATAKPEASRSDQSWVYYHRPLRESETFRYEFFYSPDKIVAHPTIGRVALLLRPDGAKSHWIVRQGWDDVIAGIQAENEVIESEHQRSAALPLEENDWNTVELKLADGNVQVTLNGDLIFERAAYDITDTRFGLYRNKRQAVKVRNVLLSGDWPDSITDDMRQNLFELTHPKSASVARAISRIATDKYFTADIREVIDTVDSMDNETAYEYLKQWVLPSETHETLRLQCELPVRSSDTWNTDFLCPATQLVDLADELGKLPELDEAVDSLAANELVTQGQKQALETLVALKKGDTAKARDLINSVYRLTEDDLAPYLKEKQRQAEFVVAWQAAKHPATQIAAHDLARSLRDKERSSATNGDFRLLADTLFGYATRQLAGDESRAADAREGGLTQWHPMIYDKPQTRAKGLRPSSWKHYRGGLQHFPGETWTQLFFQSPLRGKFEIHAERTTHDLGEVHIAYGMHAAEPEHDLSAVTVTKVMHNAINRAGELKIPRWSDRIGDFRIVVDGNTITTFTNGVKIHEEQMRSAPDPWIVLQADTPQLFSTINDLRILGTPEIPDEVRLLEANGMAGWRADVYGESFDISGSNDNAPWMLRGEELQANLNEDRSGDNRESLVMYQRAMLEGGEIEFEAYYASDKIEAHPAVGRAVFLISSAGVKLHQLTDAEWELTSKQLPDNATALPDEPISLKENDWNRYRLQLAGNTVTIFVNDQQVCARQLSEPPSSRFFGLFRYADKTGARVRNVVYRGNWPRELPSIAEQQLAYPPGGPLLAPDVASDSGTVAKIALNRPRAELEMEGVTFVGDVANLTPAKDGIRISMREAADGSSWPGLRMERIIDGNFEVVVNFRDLKIKPHKDGWGVGFALHARTNDEAATMTEVSLSLNGEGSMIVKSLRQHRLPNGERHTDVRHLTEEYASGQLKLVRNRGSMHCLIASPDGEFRHLRSFAIGSAPVSEIAVRGKCSDNVGEIDVVVSDLTLTTTREKPNHRVSAAIPAQRGYAQSEPESRIISP